MFSKHTFFVLKKRSLLIFLCALLAFASVILYFTAIRPAFQPKPLHTIVIDAGHGGRDGGAVGKATGITESEINLQYALSLKSCCESLGIKVVLTRKDENGLYNPLASNKKRSDMEKRSEIISSSGADVVVSIHMNAYPSQSSRGAQVFYGLGNERGKQLADCVQKSLHDEIEYAKSVSKEGDFYILNCTTKPGVLVEFGFLSNVEEEKLLASKSYREKACEAVAKGILAFYEM